MFWVKIDTENFNFDSLKFIVIQAGLIRREVPFKPHVPEEKVQPLEMEHLYFRKYL